MRNPWFKLGGTMITLASLITLPDVLHDWGSRLQDFGGMFRDSPVSGLALIVGITLLVLGYRDDLMRHLTGKRWSSDKELENELTTWLRDSRISVQYGPEPTPPELSFTFIATSSERPVTVMRLKGAPVVRLGVHVRPAPEHKPVIHAMDSDQTSSLLEELGIELARFGVNFNTEDMLGEGILLHYGVVITDALTQYEFVDRVTFVGRAMALVQLILIKHVREAQRQGDAKAQLTPVPQSTPGTEESQPQEVS